MYTLASKGWAKGAQGLRVQGCRETSEVCKERERSTPEGLGLPFRVGLREGPFCTKYIRTPTIKMKEWAGLPPRLSSFATAFPGF